MIRALTRRIESLPQWVFDAAVIVIAGVHLALVIHIQNQPAATLAIVGVAALVLRRRIPLAVFLATLPAATVVTEKVASMFAIYALAYRYRSPIVPWLAVAVLTVCLSTSDPLLLQNIFGSNGWPFRYEILGLTQYHLIGLRQVFYYLLLSAVPAVLAYLVRARRDLAARLVEITEAREHEQRLLTHQALAAERAQLAREMHDVVSHQVSLIAVQAGALQMQTKDPDTKESASTIRRLSVKTLEELRHMVKVLRASGVGATELAPQPTIAQLEELVGGSAIEAALEVGPLPELDPAVQRAIYRTVQEALTNARKHAPGARASVRVASEADVLEVEVVNSAPERPVVDLPGSQSGLMGLRQRAELLGGRLEYGPAADGGWKLRLSLPLVVTSAAR